jgi:hypothetical protein
MKKWTIKFFSVAAILLIVSSCSKEKKTVKNRVPLLQAYIYDSLNFGKMQKSNYNLIISNPNSSCLACTKHIFDISKKKKDELCIITDLRTRRQFANYDCTVVVDSMENIFNCLPGSRYENKLVLIRENKVKKVYPLYLTNIDSVVHYIEEK